MKYLKPNLSKKIKNNLELPLSSRFKSKEIWTSIIGKIEKWLARWKILYLCKGNWLTLRCVWVEIVSTCVCVCVSGSVVSRLFFFFFSLVLALGDN